MKRWIACLAVCALLGLLVTGCGAAGIGTKSIVRAMVLDEDEEGCEVRLICWRTDPSADAGEAQQAALLVKGSGENVYEALQNAEQSRGEELFYGQNELLLIGPRLAQRGPFEALAYLERQETGRPNVTVYLADCPASALDEQPDALDALLLSIGQLSERGGYRCYLYQLGGPEQAGLLPNLRLDLAEGAAAEDGLTVYDGGLPAHRWGQNELQLARLLTGQGKLLHFTADPADLGESAEANLADLAEGPVSFSLRSTGAVYTPIWEKGALSLEVLVQGELCRVETEAGAQSPLRDEQYELFLRAWLADLAEEMTEETFAEGNDLFCFGSHLQGLDAAAAARQAAAGKLYQAQNVRWRCDARVL